MKIVKQHWILVHPSTHINTCVHTHIHVHRHTHTHTHDISLIKLTTVNVLIPSCSGSSLVLTCGKDLVSVYIERVHKKLSKFGTINHKIANI